MLVSASEPGSDLIAGYFDTNFIPRAGVDYLFMWPDGQRKRLRLAGAERAPEGAAVVRAMLDIASREVFVRSDA